MRPSIGLALGDRYRLTRRIAIGGMGEVWVADDTYLGRDVAVKVLREEYTGNEDFLRRLRTEARNSAALSHPNIAQMYDYGEQDGTGYLVMELVLGEPLADLLEREPVIAPRKLLPILSATARGLHHAHLAKVVHRDVKPGNILLEHPTQGGGAPRGVKITDFGVSLAANQAPMTATGMVMGTAQYLSPEQAVGQPATPASDVYALGIVAYEATAGRRPFTGATPVDIAVAHVNNPVPPLPPTVHPGLADLVGRMLEKDPARRPASAAALADELDALAHEIAVDPLGARSRSARRAQAAGRPVRRVAGPAMPAGPRHAPGPVATPSEPTGVAHQVATPPEPTPRQVPDTVPPDEQAARSYATRREARAAQGDARRPSPVRRTEPVRPAPEPEVPARTSTTTGHRLGPLGRFSWPLVALLGLLVVLLVATLVARGGGDDGAAGALPAAGTAVVPAMTGPDSGMMLQDTLRPARADTIEKDD
ncbi:serine/threonine-protein kinase [Isoptericola variabilis]|uniref:non-specific serine/threonine protein kinase n=1 Tax=Isoptericola variabilis (strain 225) TaxID=743718 RepID=F6FQ85_ISOV2|nr:serine/threonine-protein kinase [Isoptericola variabilis]AEG42838.1 serine/threonine protein kinase [Isoptericola variabilis 225]TWH30978.1 serine/threonine-protein kinase [Isoptericola variabilis J7]